MTIDRSLIGKTAAPFTMQVETGKIREFATATKSTNPAYFEDEQAVSPATFLMTAVLWMRPEHNVWTETPRDRKRGLHAEQEFVFHGEPPRAGTKLTARQRIDAIYDKEGRRGGKLLFSETVTELHDETGRLVAEVRQTGILTSRPTTETP